MRRRGVVGALLALLASGAMSCASPQRIESTATAHEERAAYYAAVGEYDRAFKQRNAALKQRRKAAERSALYENAAISPPPWL